MIPKIMICSKCGAESSRFNRECDECGNVLRDKVANIDLWETLSGLVDRPGETFDKIIFAENKNFTSFFVVFATLKFFFLSLFFSFHLFDYQFGQLLLLYFQFLLLIGVFLLLPYLILKTGIFGKLKIRWRDLIAGIGYSYSPIALSAVLLIFLELIIYGGYLFERQPSPLDFKQMFGIMFLLLESIFVIWTLVLNTIFFRRFGMLKSTAFLLSIILMSTFAAISFFILNHFNLNFSGFA